MVCCYSCCRLSGLLCAACLHRADHVCQLSGGTAPAVCFAHLGTCFWFAGDLASFIFTLMPTTAVFHPAGINNNIQYCGQGFSAIPNGIGFGGQVGHLLPHHQLFLAKLMLLLFQSCCLSCEHVKLSAGGLLVNVCGRDP